jgi:hypothetical protein
MYGKVAGYGAMEQFIESPPSLGTSVNQRTETAADTGIYYYYLLQLEWW